jgi:hypothetical protein
LERKRRRKEKRKIMRFSLLTPPLKKKKFFFQHPKEPIPDSWARSIAGKMDKQENHGTLRCKPLPAPSVLSSLCL